MRFPISPKTLFFFLAVTAPLSTPALARPTITTVCQTQTNVFSEVTLCSDQDDVTGQSYSFRVTYRNGLLKESAQVLLGGMKSSQGHSFNIYDGSSDLSNKPMRVQADGSAYLAFPGGVAHATVNLYFQTPNGDFDSRYGQNYVFQF